ncbi:MAG TPA: flagellar biosynthetic protein FliO [bacterium]|nr:flagellar biosynthetic protein FliO [bacterium]HPN32835.1 flagellar biosynthetic protein FliO [bacterium]
MKNRIIKYIAVICFLSTLFQSKTFADTETLKLNLENIPQKYSTEINTGAALTFKSAPEISILKLFFKVVSVLIVILLFFFAIKRIALKRRLISENSAMFQTLSVFPLTQNKRLHLVEFSNTLYLLGVTDSNISLLDKITEQDRIDSIKLYSDMINNTGSKQNFMDFVLSAFSKQNKKEYEIKDFKHIDDYEK